MAYTVVRHATAAHPTKGADRLGAIRGPDPFVVRTGGEAGGLHRCLQFRQRHWTGRSGRVRIDLHRRQRQHFRWHLLDMVRQRTAQAGQRHHQREVIVRMGRRQWRRLPTPPTTSGSPHRRRLPAPTKTASTHPDFIKGDPEDLVRLGWSHEWRP